MASVHVSRSAALLLLPTLCAGAGDRSKGSAVESTVLVMRHCARSTHPDQVFDVPGLNFYNNYSAQPWPEFGVPEFYCLRRGADIVEGSGRWAKGQLPMPLHVTADDCERDYQTAKAFITGLGLPPAFSISPAPFKPGNISGACPRLSLEQKVSALRAQLAAFPQPQPLFSQLLAEAYAVTGDGAAGNWTKYPCEVNPATGFLDGSCFAGSEFAERWTMEWAGGLPLGWNRLKPDDVVRLQKLHAWHRQVQKEPPELVAVNGASIVQHLLGSLERAGTTIFVGHHEELHHLNGALELSWDANPFPKNATLPGSFLRFDRRGGDVTASYNFVTNFSDDSGDMTTVPVFWSRSGRSTAEMSEVQRLAAKGINFACANALAPLGASYLAAK